MHMTLDKQTHSETSFENVPERLDNSLIVNDLAIEMTKRFPSISRTTAYPASIVLVYLYRQSLEKHLAPPQGTNIAQMLDSPTTTTYHTLDVMVKAGLLRKERSRFHLKSNVYTLTSEAQKLLEEV